MDESVVIERAKGWLRNSIDAGRLSHAYLLSGPLSATMPVAKFLLRNLMCEGVARGEDDCKACQKVDSREHPDVFWVEPVSKSRQIKIDKIRELNESIWQTSFAGGWKAGVLIDADRLGASGNAFLKTLEEPPEKTIFLLLTDHPSELLPTIRSRCQCVQLGRGAVSLDEEWMSELLAVLREGAPPDPLQVLRVSGGLQAIMAKEKAQAEEDEPELETGASKAEKEKYEARVMTRVIAMRHKIVKHIIMWHRDVLMCVLDADATVLHFPAETEALKRQAEILSYSAAAKILAEAEVMSHRLERSVPAGLIFDDAMLTQAAMAYRSRMEKKGLAGH